MVKNPHANNAGVVDLIPGPGRSHMPGSNSAPALKLLSLQSRAYAPQQEKPPP